MSVNPEVIPDYNLFADPFPITRAVFPNLAEVIRPGEHKGTIDHVFDIMMLPATPLIVAGILVIDLALLPAWGISASRNRL